MNLKDLRGKIDTKTEGVAQYIDNLFEETSRTYIKQHRDWYINERFLKGEHWIVYNKTLNKVQTLPVSDGEVRRTINKIKAQVRGVKNFVKRNQPRWEVQPLGLTDSDLKEAKQKNKIIQFIYDREKFPLLITDQVINSMKCSIGIMEGGVMKIEGKDILKFWIDDTFDVVFDPMAKDLQSCRFIIKTFKKPISSIKEKYGVKDISADNKDAAVDYKQVLEQEKYNKSNGSGDDMQTAIVKETWLKWEENNKTKVRVITTTSNKTLRVFDTSYRRYPFFLYCLEKTPGALYGEPWIKHLISINKSLDKTVSQIESYIQRMLAGKFLIKQGVEVSSITDKGAEKIYYKGTTPPTQMQLQPLPSTLFAFTQDLERWLEELGGMREASLGRTPGSLQSGRAIEALQNADASTVSEPVENLADMLSDIAEFTLEIIEDFQIASEEIIQEGEKIKYIGASATNKPEDAVGIKAGRVKVVIVPEITYSETAKMERLFQLAEGKLIDPQTLLEKLNISNVGDIIERMNVAKEEAYKQEMMKQKESHRSTGNAPQDSAELADQENIQMLAGQEVPMTPWALWTPEHLDLHMAFIQENQKDINANPTIGQLFQSHIQNEEQYGKGQSNQPLNQ